MSKFLRSKSNLSPQIQDTSNFRQNLKAQARLKFNPYKPSWTHLNLPCENGAEFDYAR
ncbi:hypothetical protein CAMRE0001_1297 [Campylobacter rectus RM3267]|uniref:Uncharacterized protein n=1 Tax=Campylobacter rectus RM3267 TaxID=553218 RepID=B9CZY9_CAMRE|nr:hypothetical protein CAMRE0001_1297 [Campylobacter rectus RM3267]